MQKIIADTLRRVADDLDSGTSYLDGNSCQKILNMLNLIEHGDEELSKVEAAEYIGTCRATFDNHVRDGILPNGHTHEGTKALFWWKSDLDNYLYKN